MFHRLPSLPALRTFEAAARLKSFKSAAEELGVTPTAVSHQIRSLEQAIGVNLFIRSTRGIDLTEAGSALSPVLHDALSQIRDGVENIVAAENVVTITTTPAFAALVIAPRLGAFHAQHPSIEIQLHTGTKLVDLARERRIDIAVRYGFGGETGLRSSLLAREVFHAYSSPSYARALDDIESATLFETAWQQSILKDISWNTWLDVAGVRSRGADLAVSRFSEEHFGLQAAMSGQGLALASSVLSRDMVERGLLVPYRPDVQLSGASYTALCLPERARARKVQACFDWLLEIASPD